MLQRRAEKLDPREEHHWIESPHSGLQLFLRHLEPVNGPNDIVRPVLYVHGATFPSALSIAHRFDGYSWRDALCEASFDVWGLDFLGYGFSDRYTEMNEAPDRNLALLGALDASDQLEAAVRFILGHYGIPSLSIISHSWGAMPVCLFAGRHPTMVDRIVLFAPIARRSPIRYEKMLEMPAWRFVSIEDQWERFVEDVPRGEPPVLSRSHFDEWGERYLDTDPESRNRNPPAVKTPTGPVNDILHAWHGQLAYDPACVQVPVAIIRGAWDGLIPDEDARWLFDAFTASPLKRDIKVSRGTHLMHLEESRFALYHESIAFLRGGDQAPTRYAGTTAHRSTRREKQNGDQSMDTAQEKLAGYDVGTDKIAKSPITMEEWEELKKSALFSEEDIIYLRLSEDILADQVSDLLKTWRGVIFDHPHLRAYDEDPRTHEVDTEYTQRVGKRFGQWVLDTARAKYDQSWLDYQYEIGLRHHRTKKNKTDNGHTLGHIRGRDLIAFASAIVVPMRPFLGKKGHSSEVVNRMYDAWWKSMILQVTLWSQPYIRDGDF